MATTSPTTKPSGAEIPEGREQPSRFKRTPELELALGARIRAARIAAKMSQVTLGSVVGISFQQVQKYETGKDRIAASTLQCIAAALGLHPGSFFDDSVVLPSSPIPDMKQGRKTADVLEQVSDRRVRKQLLALVKVLGAPDDEEAVVEDVKPATAVDKAR